MKFFESLSRRGVVLTLIGFGLIAAVFSLPFQFRTKAARGLFQQTLSHDEALPNYDIRSDKGASEKLAVFRSNGGRTAVDVADIRDEFVGGEQILQKRVPTLKVEYNNDIKTPEIITPDVTQTKATLSRAIKGGHVETLLNFLNQNTQLIGARSEQVSELKVAADYTNPDGNLSFVELHQEIGGIPVFRGEVKAGFSKSGDMFRVVNNFAPGLDYASLSTDFGDPAAAIEIAADYINANKIKVKVKQRPILNEKVSTDLKAVFGTGDFATTAEKMYFPTEPGVAVAAWRVLIWQPVNAYYVIVDAQTGTMLWRKNITEDQTQAATFNVYTNPAAVINVADSPFPRSPGPISPDGSQGAAISRTLISRIGNEAPYTFNNLGWINDGDNDTNGNNVEAGLDRDVTNGVDAVNGRTVGTARTFDFPLNPSNPNTNTGDTPVPAGEPVTSLPGDLTPGVCNEIVQPHAMLDAQRASVTQLFYIANWYHDETYTLGFNEAAGNFQNVNFTGQGVAGDRVSAEGQDCSGTNNANFATPADGGRGRMQMYLWTSPNPDIDGNVDADVVIHEHTHGLSNRLHGNSTGLSLDIARGMGEGWSDFYAHCLLSEPTDPINAIYTIGAYDTYTGTGSNNDYYGIRRFPKAVMSFTGGALNRPHNPLTFADMDSTKINLSDGAFPRGPNGSSVADQVHNIGEVWSIALWEIRARMMQRLGNSVGNRRVLQMVTDGMKLAPLNPTPLSERDAILAGALASGTAADVADIWAGFALRGFGASASIQALGGSSTGGLGTVRVTEAFDLPNVDQDPGITVFSNGGPPDPGDTVLISIPLTNKTGISATGTTLELVGSGTRDYGTIDHAGTTSRDFAYTISPQAPCGGVITLTLNANSSLGTKTFASTFALGTPVTTLTENFDGVTPPAAPAGWGVTSTLPSMAFVSTATGPDTAPNSMFATDPTVTGGATELTSPIIPVTAQGANVSFRHRYNSEAGWDGGVLEISIAGGAFQDILTAGGTFLQNGYNGFMSTSTGNPIGNRPGWTGDSGSYVTTVARMPAAAAGQNIQLRWRFGADNNSAPVGGGWNVDTIQFVGSYTCSLVPTAAGVTVSGRVLTSDGRGVRNARVLLTDQSGTVRSVTTTVRGMYRLADVEAGHTYIVSVRSRRFSYSPRVLQIVDDVSGVDFVPDDQ